MGISPLNTYVGVFAVADYAYRINAFPAELSVVELSDPTAPTQTGTLALAFTPTCIAVYQGLVFIGGSAGELVIVEVDDPAAPVLLLQTSLAGQNWGSIRVVGGQVFLAGRSATTVAVFDTQGSLILQFSPPSGSTANVDIEGRRIVFTDTTASSCAVWHYRIGGQYCAFITTGSLLADEVLTETLRARDITLKGDLRGHNIVVGGAPYETSEGVGAFPGYLSINGTYFDSGPGDPSGLVTPPNLQQKGFWFRNDGAPGTFIYATTDAGVTWTAIA